MAVRNNSLGLRLRRALMSFLHPQILLHPFRLIHYYGYAHVLPRREMTLGRDVRIAPNASFRNGARISLGDQVQLGASVCNEVQLAGTTIGHERQAPAAPTLPQISIRSIAWLL